MCVEGDECDGSATLTSGQTDASGCFTFSHTGGPVKVAIAVDIGAYFSVLGMFAKYERFTMQVRVRDQDDNRVTVFATPFAGLTWYDSEPITS